MDDGDHLDRIGEDPEEDDLAKSVDERVPDFVVNDGVVQRAFADPLERFAYPLAKPGNDVRRFSAVTIRSFQEVLFSR